ncbi:glycoside hydrolase family 16 protein [Cryptosporangium aurantiacum]|uniref:Glycosyl hydrolases family 16 n=1 Tax=Cryptosporangium aurantiacum TaxID=134849 RepID=A0A1M7PDD6_9ACTN|nr:glycoside hydrolase family 16 protein [Cryptosporangium aurantiacum]SHN14946.1 Glycosyl hydrolases family 16 [Cryptosporangium aurantiacum]
MLNADLSDSPSWSHHFEGPAGAPPDPSVWTHEVGAGGWGCAQHQEYTATTDNACLSGGDGGLRVTARAHDTSQPGSRVTSARLVTRHRFTVRHGRIAARLRMPTGAGLWSAFWMLGENIDTVGWPACGEIDVVEHVSSDPTAAHGTLHGPGYSGLSGGIGHRHDHGTDLAEDFHTYSVDWTPGSVTWMLDGTAYNTLSAADVPGPWPFEQPFYLLLNLAVGGAWPGLETDAPTLPAVLQARWIRVWNLSDH